MCGLCELYLKNRLMMDMGLRGTGGGAGGKCPHGECAIRRSPYRVSEMVSTMWYCVVRINTLDENTVVVCFYVSISHLCK